MSAAPNPVKRLSLKNPWHFLALGFGSGLAPKAPGTFGSLAAIPVFLLLSPLPWLAYLALTLVAIYGGVYICARASRDMGVHDHSAIVWDEVAGMLITLFMVPVTWQWLLTGFLLFRFFDVLKPWPISWCDRHIHGGFGIMIDDVLAGFLAFACLQGLLVWLG
ncbi:MAG: phosphatidylglycerophosphatase A [Pseudomonadota bacterium]|uniref:phosphatidylglycerophosphatase A family protein n=1 Tax=Gallaecimonas pentaromativorans TaxID=584787 RepID=UPI00067E8886|nr:phosphatidylglycerophosphatase A [Gallaecimonas pentaromativorans]MED5525039.1 phosphatidylglycerophosphatase A [Pseudomonadota bacterium]